MLLLLLALDVITILLLGRDELGYFCCEGLTASCWSARVIFTVDWFYGVFYFSKMVCSAVNGVASAFDFNSGGFSETTGGLPATVLL